MSKQVKLKYPGEDCDYEMAIEALLRRDNSDRYCGSSQFTTDARD